MTVHRALLSALVFFLVTVPAVAGVEEHVLPNGLKVIMAEDHKSPLAVFQIWYRVGSRDEVSGRSGLSHLLEHMMFKGTAEHGSKELSRTVQRHGGTDNAFTSRDYTTYFQILPSNRLDISLEFESDRMGGLLLDPAETLSERAVVMEERRLRYEDDPQSSLFEETLAAAFKVHPYRRPVIGWMSDLEGIGRQDLMDHYSKYYCPDNAFIVLVGDIEPAAMLEKISKSFSGSKPCPPRESFVSAEPPQRGQRRVYLRRQAELPFVLAAYHVPSLPHPDSYALDVLDKVLSGGKSGRLYRSMVYEKKIAISAFSEYDGAYRDPFLFILGATASPGTGPDELEKALYVEVEDVKTADLSDFELQKAKNQLEAEIIKSQDSIFSQALFLGRMEVLGDWRLLEKYLDGIRGVSAEDVRRAASKYLSEDNRTVGVLVPEQPQ